MKIFVSYRRSDSDSIAGRIRDRLAGRYGDDAVFMDISSIPFGKDFRQHIQEELAQCDVLIAIVGPQWVGAEAGKDSRINDEADLVRIEVETALQKGIPIIPLLIGTAKMPDGAQLPDSLKKFPFINAAPIDTGRDFHQHVERLIRTLNETIGGFDTSASAGNAISSVAERKSSVKFATIPAQVLILPDKPSIAVLPFQNMSGDPEQDYFADGMVEDVITALSRMRWLFVIARNSTFTYKGKAVDVEQVGRELGVRYVLKGSVRKAANRVRITGQLIDAANGAHLWADRFEGSLEDIFDLQDHVTSSVVSAIAPKLEHAEIERAKRKPTESLDAYDCFLHGMENTYRHTSPESVSEGLRLFHKAIELDSNFAAAYGMAALCYVIRKASGWVTDRAQEIAEASRLARQAVELGKDDAVALAMAGHALAYVVEDFDAGAFFLDRALVLNPNLWSACFASAWLRVWIGEPEIAIQHIARLVRISPLDPLMPWIRSATAFAHVFAGRYDEAVQFAEQALSERPNSHQVLRSAALSFALAGRLEQSRNAMARLRQIDPTLRVSNLKDQTPLQRPEDLAKYAEGMRLAGLPE